jgi:hypothetical protein
MFLFQNIYTFFNSIFEILTFRTKPEINLINNNNYDEYEFIMLNDQVKK